MSEPDPPAESEPDPPAVPEPDAPAGGMSFPPIRGVPPVTPLPVCVVVGGDPGPGQAVSPDPAGIPPCTQCASWQPTPVTSVHPLVSDPGLPKVLALVGTAPIAKAVAGLRDT